MFIGTFSPDTDSQARENTTLEYKEAQKILLVTIDVEQFPHLKNMTFLPEQIASDYTNAGA